MKTYKLAFFILLVLVGVALMAYSIISVFWGGV